MKNEFAGILDRLARDLSTDPHLDSGVRIFLGYIELAEQRRRYRLMIRELTGRYPKLRRTKPKA